MDVRQEFAITLCLLYLGNHNPLCHLQKIKGITTVFPFYVVLELSWEAGTQAFKDTQVGLVVSQVRGLSEGGCMHKVQATFTVRKLHHSSTAGVCHCCANNVL